jgi:hypothetical protein
MARHTFFKQDSMKKSDVYDDQAAAGATMESGGTDIEDDLNNLRAQVNRIIHTTTPTNDWFADLATPAGGAPRGVNDLNTDLLDIEQKRLLCRVENLTDITVTAAQNWEILSQAGSETPSEVAAIGAVTTNGAVTALAATSGAGFNVHELVEVTGQNATKPKNLLVIRDSTTGQVIQSSGRDVFGLLQVESTCTDGSAFDDTVSGCRAKISFVRLNAGLDDLEAVPVGDIAGLTINYSYNARTNLDAVPEDCFLPLAGFVDQSSAVDVTLDNAIDNQSGPATQVQNIDVQITDTFSWAFQDSTGTTDILRVDALAAGDEVELNVATFDVNNTNPADFSGDLSIDTGGTQINIGVTDGSIETTGANDLRINGAGELFLDDGNQTGSTWAQTDGVKLSETTAEWDAYETAFGGEVSLLAAIVDAKNSAGTITKTCAAVTSTIPADTDASGPSNDNNLDADLGDLSGGTFVNDYDIYVNGQLMRNGANAAANFDVYPGTSLANGQLRFEFELRATVGCPDIVCVVARA